MRMFLAAALAGALLTTAGADDKEKKVEELLKDIEVAAKDKKYDRMIELAKQADEKEKKDKTDPKNPAIPFALGSAYAAKRMNKEAADAFTEVIKLAPEAAVAYDRRGDAHLKLGKFEDAVKDFDEYLKKVKDGQRKEADANHWRRGIALYYAGKYEDGAKQFERHKAVNPEDVENAVWHYLCNAKATSKEKAKKELIAVKDDTRVPMKEILEMFRDGKPEPAKLVADVSAKKFDGDPKKAAEAKKEAEFYAYLYCALYFESEGKTQDCENYMKEAVKREISHYMWDVAKAHPAKK